MTAQKLKTEIDFKRAFMIHRQGKQKVCIVPVNVVLPLKCPHIELDKKDVMLCHHSSATKTYCTPQNCPRIENAKLMMLKPKAMG